MKVSIAVPTGMLLPGALRLLSHAGVMRLSAAELGRRLLVERSGVRVILVRPADVPAYVDHGAADLGIVGKDVLWESNGSHYELVDLRFGPCRLVLAVP
ncbi:MAG TPA: ATP phosphoribosyltransferase, partial [Candidatus Dormibacteraeota bacterium]|nr:ATP phosphoribosyltransferase [Candidatus Dormibacteraeota bacterium]